ncbi:MAG TPA: DUF2339 domain-containing protein [Woeseiaceae bacterium]|nr:DUF2339 domain-containing protein [Woeseiaceae bacterium]
MGMTLILILVGAVLGGMLFGDFGGAIVGGVLGYFAAWALKLNQRLSSLEDQQAVLNQRLSRMPEEMGGAPAERPAAKAKPAVAKTVSKPPPEREPEAPGPEWRPEAPRPEVPPAAPVPPEPVVPPAAKVPPSDMEHRPPRAEPARPAMTLPPRPAPKPAVPPFLSDLIERWIFGGNPLVKIGGVVLFLGLAFALRYAAELGLLPLWLRYSAVAATGIALIVFGWRWREREDNYGLVLQGIGVGVLYLTTLAAMKLHPLLPLGVGFALLVLIAAFAAFLAITEDSMVLAVAAALGGFAAPVLASTGAGNHILLFSYLTVLNLGIVAIAWFKRWRLLNILGYVCSFGLGGAWAAEHYRDELFWSTEPFLLLLFVIYVVITMLFARRTLADVEGSDDWSFGEHVRNVATEVKYVDGTLAFGVPFSAFWVQHLLVEPFAYGTAISAIGFALFYFLLAFLLVKGAGRRYLLLNETLIALGAVFGTLSIPLFETSWTASAWAVEAAGVYWIGYRQRQLHARLFAFLVLIGAAIYFLPELRLSTGSTVLDGPILSAALLTLSAAFTYWLMWRAEAEDFAGFEHDLRPIVVGFAAVMLATLPLLLLATAWAAAALAILGVVLIYLSRRLSDRAVLGAGGLYQVAGGVMFLATLDAGKAGAVLADGWLGLLQTSIVGAAMIASAVVLAPSLFTRRREAGDSDLGAPVSAALLAGLAFINLAPLFVLSWRASAMIWPIVGIATLIWAVSVRHKGVILFSLALQVIAGVFHLRTWAVGDVVPLAAADAATFFHSGFIGPVIIALAGLVCGYFMHRGKRDEDFDTGLGWLAIGWGGLWWAFAWVMEITRVVPDNAVTPALIAVTLVTALVCSLASRRLDWSQLGQATLAYLAVLVLLGVRDVLGAATHPGAGLGALAWPVALVLHGLLLRRLTATVDKPLLGQAHAVGVWLFVVLGSFEAHWWLARWFDPSSAWPLLGTMLVPAAYVWSVTTRRVHQWWPVREHHGSYVLTAALPMIVYLLGWLWLTNLTSTGAAQPLKYLPVLNPLELAYLAVLGGTWFWWRLLREEEKLAGFDVLAHAVLAGTAFAAVTGGVIRACHHWAGVPWDADALFASDTVQASLSIVWGTLAISLMLLGNRRKERIVWFLGTALVAVVVVKLFLIELSAVGTLQRIVSFIVVGLLLLLVGYVAPLPPRKGESS